jgi:hypothetical protein
MVPTHLLQVKLSRMKGKAVLLLLQRAFPSPTTARTTAWQLQTDASRMDNRLYLEVCFSFCLFTHAIVTTCTIS